MTETRRGPSLASLTLLLAVACSPNPPATGVASAGVFAKAPPTTFDLELAALLSPSPRLRRQAFDRIAANWGANRSRIAGLTGDAEIARRIAGAWVTAQVGTREDLAALRRFLADADPRVRRAAIPGVDRLHDVDSVPALSRLLDAADFDESTEALAALAHLDLGAAERAAATFARDPGWARRRAAALVLAELDTNSSADTLLALLDDPVWQVQADAADSLGSRRWRPACEKLRHLLGHDEWQCRAAAARALGSVGTGDDRQAVAGVALGDPEKYVRRAAIAALGRFPEAERLSFLRAIIDRESDSEALQSAIGLLAQMQTPEARAAFADLSSSGRAAVRALAEDVRRGQPGEDKK